MKSKRPPLPRCVQAICRQGAWIVGSWADPACPDPGDIDVAVPFEHWAQVAPLIPANATPNKLGGWSFRSDDAQGEFHAVDVWPDTLDRLLLTCGSHAFHPLTGTHVTVTRRAFQST